MIPFIDLQAQYRQLKPEIDMRIQRVLDHGQYIMGPEVAELEEKLADYVGVPHCLGVASGTDALLIALMALGIGRGDEVITTPFSFIATAETIALLGAKPVFVDIEPKTYNVDPSLIEAAISERTRAIMPVSLYGQCADFARIGEIAESRGIPVIEDGAQSFGATQHGRPSCGLTVIGCTSFFPSKPLGCYGDGGAIFTTDQDLATVMRQIRVHGQDRRYHHPVIGINGRLDTIQAAVLLAKLEHFPEEVAARSRIGSRYSAMLSDVVETPVLEEHNTSVYAQYTIRVDDRDHVVAGLREAGVPTAVHYPICLPDQPAFSGESVRIPNARTATATVLSLPMHPMLGESDQERIAAAVRDVVSVSADQ